MRNYFRFLFLILLLSKGSISFGQNVRGFYLCGLYDFLGNPTKEDSILQYAQSNGFNYFAFYDLGYINWNSSTDKDQLGAFITKARIQYGVSQFGAVVESYDYAANKILPYNNSRNTSDEKFDVINQEFEFWANATISSSYCSHYLSPGGYSCDTAGAWKFAWLQFSLIDSMCAANGLISEVYVGWPTAGQMSQLASIADRILLHAYRVNDADVYAYSKNRLKDIASINTPTNVLPIFSSEPVFMGPWLNSNSQSKPFQTYSNNLSQETGSFKQFINLEGYQWFTYNLMPKTNLASATISASGPTSFCSGGSVTLTANPGVSYLWSPGGETSQSITVTSAGTFSVTVVNSTGNSAISSPIDVTIATSGSTPSIYASGPLSFCPGGSVTLTASQASNYLWSTGETTQSIVVYTSGAFSVTTGSGSCTGTSTAMYVNAASVATTPTITTTGSLNVCPGSSVMLTSSPANGYLWSTGETTQSIVVSSAGSYTVNAYSGPNCSAASVPVQVNNLSAPAAPSISVTGPTTLTQAQPTVSLMASYSNDYLWTTGETTQTIVVNTAGSYIVKITDSNGCFAESSPLTISSTACVPPAVPTITLSGPSIINPGQSITLTSSQAPGYLWATGETTQSITVYAPGTYYVRVYNSGYCYSNSLPLTVIPGQSSGSTDVPFIANGNSENIFLSANPNPAREFVNLAFHSNKTEHYSIKLFDITGREIMMQSGTSATGLNEIPIDVSSLRRGLYLVSLMGDERKEVVKLILE